TGQRRTSRALFDHRVSAGKYRRRNCEVQSFRGLEVNHHLVLGWGLHGKVTRLFAFEDAIDIPGRTLVWLDSFSPITNQAINPTQFLQALQECGKARLSFLVLRRQTYEHANVPYTLPLLGARQERSTACRPGNSLDEISPAHVTISDFSTWPVFGLKSYQ